MKKPNVEHHKPDPRYLRRLVEDSGLSQVQAARRLGLDPRTVRRYLAEDDPREAPYVVQYALEALAGGR